MTENGMNLGSMNDIEDDYDHFREGSRLRILKNVQNKLNPQKLRSCCNILKSDTVKIISVVFVVLCLTFLIINVITINSELKEAKILMKEEQEKLVEIEIKLEKSELMDDFQRITKLESKVARKKLRLDELEKSHKHHKDHVNKTNHHHKNQLAHLNHKLQATKDKIDDYEFYLRLQNETLSNHSLDLKNLKNENKYRHPISTNGIMIWKITNFTELLFDPISGKHSRLSSEPFYTSQFGYKMCLTFNPNGRIANDDYYIAINVRPIKGEFDDILTWPLFSCNVTIMVLDQSMGSAGDIAKSVTPSFKYVVFQKPTGIISLTSNNNQLVIPYKNLTSLRHDSFYIKAVVEVN